VASYTRQLAEANGIDVAGPPEDAPDSVRSEITSLRRHLEVQKRIFGNAA